MSNNKKWLRKKNGIRAKKDILKPRDSTWETAGTVTTNFFLVKLIFSSGQLVTPETALNFNS